MPSVIFDLDGTLIDSKQRLYRLFIHLLPYAELSADDYWKIKQAGIGHEVIISSLKQPGILSFSDFQMRWMELIESDEYLAYDKPFNFSTALLKHLQGKGIELCLLTARQFPDKVHQQLQAFGWLGYFTEVWVTQQKETKKDLLVRVCKPADVIAMIGDTGHDVCTANELGIPSVAVLTGFHSKETLIKYNPSEIIEKAEYLVHTKAFQSISHA